MMKKVVAAIVVVLVLAAVGYVAAGPYLTLANIRKGVTESDPALLDANVDFPLLRENLKVQLSGSIANAVKPDESSSGENAQVSEFKKNLSKLSAEFADKFASKMVDALVTPAGIAKIAGTNLGGADSEKKPFLKDVQVAVQSLDTVHVIGPGQEGSDAVKFVLSRRGAKWRLTNILLPLETAPPAAKE